MSGAFYDKNNPSKVTPMMPYSTPSHADWMPSYGWCAMLKDRCLPLVAWTRINNNIVGIVALGIYLQPITDYEDEFICYVHRDDIVK